MSLDTYRTAHPRKVVPLVISVPFSEKIVGAIIFLPGCDIAFMRPVVPRNRLMPGHEVAELYNVPLGIV